jgi:TrmH family RNA methyltransferase
MDIVSITSAQNPVAKKFRMAAAGKNRDLILIEGRHMLREALKAGWQLEDILVQEDRWEEWSGELAPPTSARRIYRVPPRLLERLSTLSAPEGVMALGIRPAGIFPSPKPGDFFLYLDAVQDPVNTGILVRSARAFGASCVFAGEGTCDPFRLTALFRSGGAAFHVPVLACTSEAFLDWALSTGVALLAAVPGGRLPEPGTGLQKPFAILLGNEGRGLSPQFGDRCAQEVGIPMVRGWDSLNVAVAGSILMHEFSTRRERG